MIHEYDALIIGAGGTGLITALEADKRAEKPRYFQSFIPYAHIRAPLSKVSVRPRAMSKETSRNGVLSIGKKGSVY